MAENASPIAPTDLYNSSPSKIQPWMQATGGIPQKTKQCVGTYDPEVNSTHGIPQGSLLVMENAPKGLRPKTGFWRDCHKGSRSTIRFFFLKYNDLLVERGIGWWILHSDWTLSLLEGFLYFYSTLRRLLCIAFSRSPTCCTYSTRWCWASWTLFKAKISVQWPQCCMRHT